MLRRRANSSPNFRFRRRGTCLGTFTRALGFGALLLTGYIVNERMVGF